MSIYKQNSNGKGSLKDIQNLINKHPDLLDALLNCHNASTAGDKINWFSPLAIDHYSEYRDDDFIQKLGIKLIQPLPGFWPKLGPQWDALGKSDNGIVFLVEAKANIPEIVSTGTKASPKSKSIIDKSLEETKLYLNIKNVVDWSGTFYQYTNRLAHLYFLRVINNIDAFLVNIYFLNDKTVNGPKSKDEWLAAIKVMKLYLGLSHHKLSKYMIDLFIDVDDINNI